jgi:hypothetical protein
MATFPFSEFIVQNNEISNNRMFYRETENDVVILI